MDTAAGGPPVLLLSSYIPNMGGALHTPGETSVSAVMDGSDHSMCQVFSGRRRR
jgi:hypothetical protein